MKSLARGRLVTPAGVADSVLGLLFFLFRAMRKPSQPLLGHGQSGLPEEAESRSCPTSFHTPDPEPSPPPLLAEPPPALALVRFANFNFKLLLPIRQIQIQIVCSRQRQFPPNSQQLANFKSKSTKKKLLKKQNKNIGASSKDERMRAK